MTQSPPTLRGAPLLCAAVNQILRHPKTWDQSAWPTNKVDAGCVFCWAQRIAYGVFREGCTGDLLGLSNENAIWLINDNRTLPEIYGFAASHKRGDSPISREAWVGEMVEL